MKAILVLAIFALVISFDAQSAPNIDGVSETCVFHLTETDRTEPLDGDIQIQTTTYGGFQAFCQWYGEYDPQPRDFDVLWFQDVGPCFYNNPEDGLVYFGTNVINVVQPNRYGGRTLFALSCTDLQPIPFF